ncbi:LETM1-like protein-domain-containing protein [Fimicolochytrium jonesii]|uniref:LETM1-like protein-domain-containing protein n=1 Tax=Fimicolochytrium jonesii TaxID=1396493 RepID=UPI0022FE5DFB|nr:LETM1-like protein-domain-containing protein [Fimicolochytrium jonesii]KAI8821717.1 LETM1-like protein-domain-containing protein [Fimicolochytrium jonesii]
MGRLAFAPQRSLLGLGASRPFTGLPTSYALARPYRSITSTPNSATQRPSTTVKRTQVVQKPSSDSAVATPGLGEKAKEFFEKSKAMMKQIIAGGKIFMAETKECKELKRRNTVEGYEWTRKEYFLIKKNERDFWKAIPFVFCCVFLGEAIPFLLLRGIVPSPCLTPEQVEAKTKRLQSIRQELGFTVVEKINDGESVGGQNVSPSSLTTDAFLLQLANTQPQYFHITHLKGSQLRDFNKYLGIWRFGPAPYLRRVLRQHEEYIRRDDQLLLQEGFEDLSVEEVKAAVDARGLPSVGISESQMRADLKKWIELSTSGNPDVPFSLILLAGVVRTHLQGSFTVQNRIESREEEKTVAVASG